MNCDTYRDWLGDAVEGTLDPDRHAALEAHCAVCAACRGLVDDLTKIRATASALDRHTPSPAVWSAIEARTAGPRAAPVRRSRVARSWAPLAAAAALAAMLGAAVWFGRTGPVPAGGPNEAAELARSAASELQLAEEHYMNAIAALERLTVQDDALDPAIAAEIAGSLRSIDRAIADSRAALASHPGSFVAQTSLLEALRMKVALLQETVSLMNAAS